MSITDQTDRIITGASMEDVRKKPGNCIQLLLLKPGPSLMIAIWCLLLSNTLIYATNQASGPLQNPVSDATEQNMNKATDQESKYSETSHSLAAKWLRTPAQNMGVSEQLTAANKKMSTIVSVNFLNTPFNDVVRSLSDQADLDIVISPHVTGSVTATLTDVPLREVLDTILAVHGYGYIVSENIVRIVPKSEQPSQHGKLKRKLFRISYAEFDDVVQSLAGIVSSRGEIATNSSTATIMVTGTAEQLTAIEEFIREVDREVPQILVDARIYDISSRAGLDVGFDWFASRRTAVDQNTGAIIAGDTEPYIFGDFGSAVSKANRTSGSLRFGILNANFNLDVLFTAKQDHVQARLLANPKILVVNNEQAKIEIVAEIPYQQLTQTTAGGNIGTTQFKNVGVQLEVTPRITRNEKVLLRLSPVFSVHVKDVAIVIPTVTQAITSPQPVIDRRSADTTALISSGHTVVIGGLRQKNRIREQSKIPLLSDIPLLGGLFRFTGEEVVNSELVVFVTPYIIVDETVLSEREQEQFQQIHSELWDLNLLE